MKWEIVLSSITVDSQNPFFFSVTSGYRQVFLYRLIINDERKVVKLNVSEFILVNLTF